MNKRILQKKVNREWKDINDTTTDNETIFKSLANELMNKYVYKSLWVKRVEYDPYYDGEHNKIVVFFDNGFRHVYIIEK